MSGGQVGASMQTGRASTPSVTHTHTHTHYHRHTQPHARVSSVASPPVAQVTPFCSSTATASEFKSPEISGVTMQRPLQPGLVDSPRKLCGG
jgi:hypothetical protein